VVELASPRVLFRNPGRRGGTGLVLSPMQIQPTPWEDLQKYLWIVKA